jgi:hypothetical protein
MSTEPMSGEPSNGDKQQRPRRRAVVRRRFRPSGSAVAAVVVLLLGVAAVLVAGARQPVPAEPPSAHGQPVTDVLAACQPGSHRARILTGSLPDPALGSTGSLAVRDLSSGARKSVPLQRGRLTTLQPSDGVTALEATGPVAAGHFGMLVDPASGALAASPCVEPRSTWWFTGAGATLDHTSRLVIANVDPGPAVVDVRVLGESGPVSTIGTRGITIAPGAVRTIALTDIAPQGSDLSIQVQASRGRVAAAVSDSFASAPGAAAGKEWLPDQGAASRVVRIAATPSGSRHETLLLANPTQLNALVGLRIEGKDGEFRPVQHAQIQVPPGSTRAVDISDAVQKQTGALLLHSRVPVLASLRSVSDGDSVYAGTVRPLEGAAAAAWGGGVHAKLLLTAGALPATATVAAFDESGDQLGTDQLQLAAGSTTSWKPPGRAEYLTVTPGHGAVYGSVLLSGPGSAEIRLDSPPVTLQRPVVQPGYSSP